MAVRLKADPFVTHLKEARLHDRGRQPEEASC